jgi:hypothetical protein
MTNTRFSSIARHTSFLLSRSKDSFAREAQGKESRLYLLLDGLGSLCRDSTFMELLRSEQLDRWPELTGKYNVAAQPPIQEGTIV